MNYEVYVAKDWNGKPLYVGSGKENRHLHCNSGVSHSYELNRFHHSGSLMDVTVIRDGLSKEESLRLEYDLINALEPAFNKKIKNGSTQEKYTAEDVNFNDVSDVINFLAVNTDDVATMRLILHYTVVPEITYIVGRVLNQKNG